MKLFNLCWYWHEDQNDYLFIHIDKTKEQFKLDVEYLLKKYGTEYIKSAEGDWVGANDWISFISDKMHELGYVKPDKITASFFGAYIIRGDAEDDENFGKIVGKELYEKAIKHNEDLQIKLDRKHSNRKH